MAKGAKKYQQTNSRIRLVCHNSLRLVNKIFTNPCSWPLDVSGFSINTSHYRSTSNHENDSFIDQDDGSYSWQMAAILFTVSLGVYSYTAYPSIPGGDSGMKVVSAFPEKVNIDFNLGLNNVPQGSLVLGVASSAALLLKYFMKFVYALYY